MLMEIFSNVLILSCFIFVPKQQPQPGDPNFKKIKNETPEHKPLLCSKQKRCCWQLLSASVACTQQ